MTSKDLSKNDNKSSFCTVANTQILGTVWQRARDRYVTSFVQFLNICILFVFNCRLSVRRHVSFCVGPLSIEWTIRRYLVTCYKDNILTVILQSFRSLLFTHNALCLVINHVYSCNLYVKVGYVFSLLNLTLHVIEHVIQKEILLICLLKGTVQRDLRGVKSGINR